jgi:hypothetical protein
MFAFSVSLVLPLSAVETHSGCYFSTLWFEIGVSNRPFNPSELYSATERTMLKAVRQDE